MRRGGRKNARSAGGRSSNILKTDMNAKAIEGSLAEEESGSHQPLYFLSAERQLFGWLHRPEGPFALDWGVVICKPFGYEALCAHRSIRAFADAAAALGMPALRFDYVGAGDSAELDSNADQVEAWTADIANAVAELRRRTGVTRVCLLGFRLGALFAARAAARSPVDALALIAPVLNGRKYVREARTVQLAAQAADESVSSPEAESPDVSDGGMEVSGYPLSAASIASLSTLEVTAAALGRVADVLLIDRSDLPGARAWAEALGAGGVRAEYRALPGLIEMMMRAPHLATLPQQMLDATRDWLARLRCLPSPAQAADTIAPRHVVRVPSPQLVLAGEDGSSVTERPIFLDEERRLFGIVTEPRRGETRRRAVIFLNTGADHHIGASRMYVSLARRWALKGYHVLRMDLSGLGDSRPRAGRPDNEVFPVDAIADIRAAVGHMRGAYRCGDITLLGLCSGAYHALRAAAEGVAVSRVLMVNPETFFWKEGANIRDIQLADLVHTPTLYRTRALSLKNWRRLVSGQVDVVFIVKLFLRRMLFAAHFRLRDLMRLAGLRHPQDLGRELEKIAARGIRMVIVFARGEPGIEVLRLEGGPALTRLGDRLLVRILEVGDHTFSRSGPRRELDKVLSEELFTRPVSRAASPVPDAQRIPLA